MVACLFFRIPGAMLTVSLGFVDVAMLLVCVLLRSMVIMMMMAMMAVMMIKTMLGE